MDIPHTDEDMTRILEILEEGRLYQSLDEVLSGKRSTEFKALSTPEILFMTSYPPRECGIATYSQDLIKMLNTKFQHSFAIKVCALERDHHHYSYPDDVDYVLDTGSRIGYKSLVTSINSNDRLELIVVQHEFGFFYNHEADLKTMLSSISKPVVLIFHTVLPRPDNTHKQHVLDIAGCSAFVVVMTRHSAEILKSDYGIPPNKISVIAHGTHLVPYLDKHLLKKKYTLSGKQVMSTFGLLSEGKSIETTLKGMPSIIKENPDVLFLIIGKTHPTVAERDGEKYRDFLKQIINNLDIGRYVRFINAYLPLPELLEYLQLSDIYLFTSKNPNQAVSGTFSYALSCGCPIVSTPIPHALEVLGKDAGLIIDFENHNQLANAVNGLFADDNLRKNISNNSLHKIAATAWENSALAHMDLFEKTSKHQIASHYTPPPINLAHIQRMTDLFGMVQFANINHPDIDSGYTLDDNARALIAMCMHFDLTKHPDDLILIEIYLNFIDFCQQDDGTFLNYINEKEVFTKQNFETNLEDPNGRAIWALGYVISKSDTLPAKMVAQAKRILEASFENIEAMHSTRAMSFAIKGLHFSNQETKSPGTTLLIILLANRLVQMYRHESGPEWKWFESYLTYANSLLPEALLYAYSETDDPDYKKIAVTSFDFLLSTIYTNSEIKVVSNQGWHVKGQGTNTFGEQPIDVAYTIMALSAFYGVFQTPSYWKKMKTGFNWFLGNNHLNQIIYNPCTGGCYDGLEEHHVNLNQGAESTVSYLLSRLTMEKYLAPSLQKLPAHILTASQA